MRAVVQRVSSASVSVDGVVKGAIKEGFMVLLGVSRGDCEKDAQYIADKVSGLRVFSDEEGKFNLSIQDAGGSVLVVSQFTLYGDARAGRRPSFTEAARAALGEQLYELFMEKLRGKGLEVSCGVFGASMQVSLVNEGPVTILLDSSKLF